MFRATFNFVSHSDVCGLEIDAVASRSPQAQGLQLTYRVKLSLADEFKVVHVGQLPGYAIWSEAPLALLLRSLFSLRVEWFSAIPQQLISKPVLDMSLSILRLTKDGQTGPALASLSLKKSGYEAAYILTQSVPNRALIPLTLDAWGAVPFAAATEATAAVQLERIDLHTFPEPHPVSVLTDEEGRHHVLRNQLPYFAIAAFEAYRDAHTTSSEKSAASIRAESLVDASDWADFLAA